MSDSVLNPVGKINPDTVKRLVSQIGNDQWQARFGQFLLQTALQPIFSLSHKRVVGYEALVRPFDNQGLSKSPADLFRSPRDEVENVLLDRLCRYLHLQNFSRFSDDINWLFINVSPETIATGSRYDSYFGKLLSHFNFPPHRIVVEIVEQPSSDPELLAQAVAYYKQLGCLTALDDFGAGHSNFERIWSLQPDIVKLDRKMIERAADNGRTRQLLNGIVALLHQAGCLVLMEGVESQEQALLAIDCGADFVQGFYFARPELQLRQPPQALQSIDLLLSHHKEQIRSQKDPGYQLREFYDPLMLDAVTALMSHHSLIDSVERLMGHPTVSRCYLVDEEGIQIEQTITSGNANVKADPRFRPLEDTRCADWFRKHYLRRALTNPDSLQITRPYLSVTGAYMCITLSRQFQHEGQTMILCCDLLAD